MVEQFINNNSELVSDRINVESVETTQENNLKSSLFKAELSVI